MGWIYAKFADFEELKRGGGRSDFEFWITSFWMGRRSEDRTSNAQHGTPKGRGRDFRLMIVDDGFWTDYRRRWAVEQLWRRWRRIFGKIIRTAAGSHSHLTDRLSLCGFFNSRVGSAF